MEEMKEQLISFKTAKLAKERGFDIYTINSFDLEGNFIPYSYNPKMYIKDCRLPIPTQSLLLKWLRRKYGLIISLDISHAGIFVIISSIKGNKLISRTLNKSFFLIEYEEAIEYGSQKALKSIKIKL